MPVAQARLVAQDEPKPRRSFKPGEAVSIDGSRPTVSAEVAALQVLLRVERDARRAASEQELLYLVANETRKLVPGRQFFALSWDEPRLRIAAVSSLTTIDREAPFVHWLETMLARRFDGLPATPVAFDAFADGRDANDYPFDQMLILPMRSRDAQALGALLIARETPWNGDDQHVGERLAETYGHAWSAFRKPPPMATRMRRPAALAIAATCVLLFLCLTGTRMTALAGSEIVPSQPFVVAASSDGVIESIEVGPNAEVKQGDILYRTVSTTLQDNLLIAERAASVAEAKWKALSQAAFIDQQAKRDLAAAQAEYELKLAERDYARDLVAKTVVRAPRAGIAIFNDANDLVGRPVSTGQRIMEIADRTRVLVRINVAVEDSIVLAEGARAKIYIDSDPLNALEATITHADHGARLIEGNQFVYRAEARLEGDAPPPRLGVRGTAQIFGPSTSLMLYLFRRPISYLRQHVGL